MGMCHGVLLRHQAVSRAESEGLTEAVLGSERESVGERLSFPQVTDKNIMAWYCIKYCSWSRRTGKWLEVSWVLETPWRIWSS